MDALLQNVISLSEAHAKVKGESVDTWFNRALHERVANKRFKAPVKGWQRVTLKSGEVQISEEKWPLERLTKFPRWWHKKKNPARDYEPLIVVRIADQEYLVDGLTRINKWEADGNSGPHAVLVVQPVVIDADPFPSTALSGQI